MAEFISKFWLTGICMIILAIWGVKANKTFKASVAKNPFGDYQQPQTASVLGVLGTFFGISIGLLNFNPAQDAIHQSVINLLGGMTTAFFTSIVGMGISLYFKNYQADAQKNFKGTKTDEPITELLNYLRESDAQKTELIKNFSETLAESNTKVFIAALEDAVKDFNKKISEQFGENFKEFNVAVGRLLEWQENYKTIIEIVTENFQATIEGIGVIKSSLEQIEKSAASMTKSSEQIQDLIVTANFYSEKLESVLKEIQTLGEISKSAAADVSTFVKNSCDEIKTYTEKVTQDINSHVNSVADNLENQMSGVTKNSAELARQIVSVGNTSLEKIVEVSESYAAEIKTYTEKVTQDINSHVNSVTDNLENKAQNITIAVIRNINLIENLSEELRNESYKIISDTNKKMNELMKTNDENLKKSLETLGRAMLKISGKFVEDYTPLVNELRKIVEISKQVRGDNRF